MRYIHEARDTWDDASTVYVGIGIDVTATAYDANSKITSIKRDGTDIVTFSEDGMNIENVNNDIEWGTTGAYLGACPNGTLTNKFFKQKVATFGGSDGAIVVRRDFRFGWSEHPSNIGSNARTTIINHKSQIAGEVELAAAVEEGNPHSLRIYDNHTDEFNYSRLNVGSTDTAFELAPVAAGTGTELELHISGFPTTDPGPGILWNNGGLLAMGT